MKRRSFLSCTGATVLTATLPSSARSQTRPLLDSDLRGTRSALEYGIAPDSAEDQSERFQTMLDAAAASGDALFLPSGFYRLRDIRLPSGLLMDGVPGRSRLIHTGSGALLRARGCKFHHVARTDAGWRPTSS